MTDIRPIQQPPAEDLRNALQIVEMGRDGYYATGRGNDSAPETIGAFRDAARLIRAALEKLAEPNAGAIRAARVMIAQTSQYNTRPENVDEREARDCAAAVVHAQLTEIP